MRTVKEPEIRRQELIETALKLFLKKGYEKTSVRDILKEEAIQYCVEISTRILFQVFKRENFSFMESMDYCGKKQKIWGIEKNFRN